MNAKHQRESFDRQILKAQSVAIFRNSNNSEVFAVLFDVIIDIKTGQFHTVNCNVRVHILKFKQQLCIEEPKDRRHTGKRKILRTAVEHCENFLLSVVVLLHNEKKFIINQLAVIGQYAALDGALKQLAVQFRF